MNQIVEVDFSECVWELSLDCGILALQVGHRVLGDGLLAVRVEGGKDICVWREFGELFQIKQFNKLRDWQPCSKVPVIFLLKNSNKFFKNRSWLF